MKNNVPRRPAALLMFLVNLLAGDAKHPQDGVVDPSLRSDLQTTKGSLESLVKGVTTSKGQYRQDSDALKSFILTAITFAEKFRDAVFSKFGHDDKALADYGLAPRRKSRKAGSAEAGSESAASKAEKKLQNAQLRLSKAQTKLEKTQAALAKAQAVLVKRQAEVALTTPATAPEPSAPTEPTSTSGTK